MKGISILTILGLALSATPAIASYPINNIHFDNQTSLSLGATIAGFKGKDILANQQTTVPYVFLHAPCFYNAPNPEACPVEFYDKATSEKVASVIINAKTATVISTPVLYGKYNAMYDVDGWHSQPLDKIVIKSK